MPTDAAPLFHDIDWDIRGALQERYVREGALEPVASYHSRRFKLVFGRNEPWPDEPAAHALQLFASRGAAHLGVALVRAYVDLQHTRLKRDYAKRNPRKPRSPASEGVERTIAAIGVDIAAAVPDRKAELIAVLERMEPYLEAHAMAESRARLEEVRRELWMERRA